MGDNLGAPDMVAAAKRLDDLGCDYVILILVTMSGGELLPAGGRCPSPLDQLREVVAAVSKPVQAVGGLSVEQAIRTPEYGAPLWCWARRWRLIGFVQDGGRRLEGTLRFICETVAWYLSRVTRYSLTYTFFVWAAYELRVTSYGLVHPAGVHVTR